MKPHTADSDFTLYCGDVLDVLPTLEAESAQTIVTSPPYWGLRDYGTGVWEGGDPLHSEPDESVEPLRPVKNLVGIRWTTCAELEPLVRRGPIRPQACGKLATYAHGFPQVDSCEKQRFRGFSPVSTGPTTTTSFYIKGF